MRKPRVLRIVVVLAILSLGTAAGEAQIQKIEIVNLVPFTVSFQFSNPTALPQENVRGTATLRDMGHAGQGIDQVPVGPFSADAGALVVVEASSRWEYQIAGAYLLEIALEVGGTLTSGTLPFQILPVALPLAPSPSPSPGLYTVYQQPSNWGLVRIGGPKAWTVSHGNPAVIVAVIDSGVDARIPQVAASLWTNPDEVPGNGVDDDYNGYVDDVHGWDFRDNDASSLTGTPLHGHGTFVASIIAARPGEYPIVGVAPGVSIMDVRFLDSSNRFGSSDWRTFVRAIEYAVNNGARIINLSIFSNARPPDYFEQALSSARARGVIIVGISGNLGENQVMYPGKYGSVLAVSATDRGDLLAAFSNRGPEVAVCAPGDEITAFTAGGRPATESGTSFAAPHVSGILALILSLAPELSADKAIAVLESSCEDLGQRGRDALFGNGLVDAWGAVERLRRP
ncbi:MAG: S8 family serine peptidase [Candidatus Bipolaricaulota bacterium]|nr:S8 family serine peptidase [Candidatus Bipolaricaulota bacterium]